MGLPLADYLTKLSLIAAGRLTARSGRFMEGFDLYAITHCRNESQRRRFEREDRRATVTDMGAYRKRRATTVQRTSRRGSKAS
jgi:hypothetical protein